MFFCPKYKVHGSFEMLLRLDGRLVFIRLNILSRGSAHTAQAALHTNVIGQNFIPPYKEENDR